ncbi:DNA-binding response regulator, AraC family [hydrothermal vent metagenome]|uniref:DNA-binding response regulator, AraC family n=1 Tax=hydrothermal vent metagenome TaxID=652676 RepID=A0A3B1CGB2_9ZZZZ
MINKSFVKNINRILFLNLLAASFSFTDPAFIFAQDNFVFENLSIPQGLSNPTINCIYEDKYGFLWLGTEDGLSRYDGYDFKVYKNNPSDSASLPGNSIRTINEDNNGNLWIGGSNVLAKYDRKNNTFKSVKFDSEQNLNQPIIRKIFIDKNNKIWICTDLHGVHLLNPKTMTTKRKKFILNNEEIPNGFIFSIIETSDKELLVADYGSGVFYYNEDSDEFHLYNNLGRKNTGASLLVLYEDEFKRIWIGGERSLFIYNRNTKKTEHVELFSNPSSKYLTQGVIDILKDKEGFLWLATLGDGLYRYNPADDNFLHFTGGGSTNNIKSAGILSLLQDSFGNIWIGTKLNGLYKVDPNKQPMNILKIPEEFKTNSTVDRITVIAKSEKYDNIAIGTAGLGIFWGNLQNGKFKNFHVGQKSNGISSNNVSALTIDKENNLWVGSDAGIDRLNPISGKIRKYFDDKVNYYRGFNVMDMKFDKAGRLFVAYTGGVDVLFPNQNIIKKIPSVANRELKPDLQKDIIKLANSVKPIASILKVSEQKIFEQEFSLSDSAKIIIIGVGEGQTIFEIMSDFGWIEDENNKLIWGMHNTSKSFHFQGGIKNRIMLKTLRLKKGKYKLKYLSDVGHYYSNYNVQAPKDSSLWGIQVIRINDKQFRDFSERIDQENKNSDKMLVEIPNSIFISKSYENILWIGTTAQGLFKYNLSDGEFTQYKKNTGTVADYAVDNDVYFVMEDNRGIVWFSSPNGLGKLNPKTEKIKYFTAKDGLPTNLISAIQEDNFGNLWISSSAGLTTLVRNSEGEKETFINIDVKDGLQGYSFSRATWKTKNGELFFGGYNGLNYFTPARTNQTKPKIVFTDLKISDVSVFSGIANSPLKNNLNDTDELTLNYSQNNIAFQFAPIHYSRPQRNLIAYKLEGLNKEWVYSKLHFASFTNLEPGEYTFKLKAANGDGIWSDEEKTIHIKIKPPYWRTTFAYFLYAFGFVGFIFGIDRIQRRRLLAKTKEKMKYQEAEHRAETAELQAQAAEAQAKVIQIENERKTKELEEARQLQLSMLPKELPNLPHLDIAVYMQTATEVGGDYYDFSCKENGSINICLGDATGHGMKAGTLVSMMKSLFTANSISKSLEDFFSSSNQALKNSKLDKMMMAFAMVNINGSKVKFCNAGIPPFYLIRNNEIEELNLHGMPLGAMNNTEYKVEERKLSVSDTILMMSDGFPELQNRNGEMFGYDLFKEELEKVKQFSAAEIIEHFKKLGSTWTENKDPDDDVTFVVIKMK